MSMMIESGYCLRVVYLMLKLKCPIPFLEILTNKVLKIIEKKCIIELMLY